MTQLNEATLLNALRGMKHPQTGHDIVDDGLVTGLVIRDGNVGFALQIHPEEAESCEELRLACEEKLRQIPGVLSATVVLTAHQSAPQMKAEKKPPENTPPAVFDRIGAVIAVASGKGGVGKSTVAVNLAAALSEQGQRVGFLDADIYGPSAPQLLGVTEKPEVDDNKKIIPVERYGMHTMSIGYMVPDAQAMVWRGPMVQGALLQMLNDVVWPALDIMVLDLPPGTGDIQLTMAQQIPVTGALVVTTPQNLAVADVRRSLTMFKKTKTPVLGIIENMSWLTTPNGDKLYPFGQGGGEHVAAETDSPLLTALPLDTELQKGSETGTPIVRAAPESEAAAAFRQLAVQLLEKLS